MAEIVDGKVVIECLCPECLCAERVVISDLIRCEGCRNGLHVEDKPANVIPFRKPNDKTL